MNNDSREEKEDRIVEAIEDINTDSGSVLEELVEIDPAKKNVCQNCGFEMVEVSACSMQCKNCGNRKECGAV